MEAVKVLSVIIASVLTVGADTNYSIYEIPEEIIANGYPAERHHVVTEDGYILEMHRIPKGKDDSSTSTRPVVFLMHGLLSSSQAFIAIGPKSGVAYNLADAGFEVWMGNARGNRLSRNHTTLNPDDPQEKFPFFNFSFEEIGRFDVAAMVDYALKVTGQSKLHYIGHSQGGTVFMVLTTMRPEYNEKFKSAHLLAGVGYQDYFPNKNISRLSLLTDVIYQLSLSLGVVELFPPNVTRAQEVQPDFCTGNTKYSQICELLGMTEIMENNDTSSKAEVAGAALKQVAHFGQNIRDKSFWRWNYGPVKNLAVYGNMLPPKYDLGLISTSVTMHYTIADTLLDERDVLAMVADIPNAIARKVARDTFSHGDFTQADDCKELVTDYIIEAMLKLETNTAQNEVKETRRSNTASSMNDEEVLKNVDEIITIEPPIQNASPNLALSVLLKTLFVIYSMKLLLS
ncbi:lipase 3-like [Ostrinia furnacalis]|uniref:lipase 3-like n=1 Tax=Ostrinia furnacalis TaxID=93504 RepID=UPI00103E4134|nr:lipase 3-like [Ostrinia furnacalis]